jgi:outer membrane receptor protein involved in Fe transport
MNGERTKADEIVVNDDYERRGGALSAGLRSGSAWVRADVRHSADERGFPGPFGSNPAGNYGGIDVESRGENERTLAAISTSLPVSSRIRGQAHIAFNRIESDFRSPFGASEGLSRRWVGRVQTDVSAGRGVDVSTGIEIQRERAGSSFITGTAFQAIPVERATAGYFAEARLNSHDRVFATAGVRIEHIHRERLEPSGARPELNEDDVVSANPRLSGAWIVRGGASAFTKVRGAAGSGIRPPDGFELAFTDNPALRPERSVSAEAGIDQAFAGGLGLLEATIFLNQYDDLIVFVGSFSGSSRYRTDNISNARARGLELAVTMRRRIAGARPIDLSGRVGYTRLATEVLAVDQDDAAPPPFVVGQPLLRRPKHQFFVDATLTSGRVTAFLRGGGRSSALDVEPSFGTSGGLFDAEGFHVWNTGASWRFSRFAEVFARVENLFDRSYEEAFGFPALGRRATAGLRIAAGR